MAEKSGKADEWLRVDTYEEKWTGFIGAPQNTWRAHIYSHNFQRRGQLIAYGNTKEAAQKAAATKLREFADLLDRGEGAP